MSTTALKRQFIRDETGNPIGVILPFEDFVRVAQFLGANVDENWGSDQLEQIEYAVKDPLFLADLRETMDAFESADAQWWEREE